MLNTMVSSTVAGEMSPALHSSHDVIYSPVPQQQHNTTSTSPHMLSCEYHPAYGPIHISGSECTYYAPPGHESYTYMGPADGSYPPQLVNVDYGKFFGVNEEFQFPTTDISKA